MIALLSAWILGSALAVEPELVRLSTADGAEVVVHHTPGAGPPVLLVHGVSSNHRFWDMAPGFSLADHLAEAGFDVWNVDLRSHGDALRLASGRKQDPDADIDAYGEHDIPAVVAHVRSVTGASRVHYVGHSMGGMVLAIYLASHGDEALASAVVVASPLDLRDPDRIFELLLGAGHLVGPIRRLPTPLGARGLALFKRTFPGQVDVMLHNPENVDPRVEGRMFRTVVSPLTRGEIGQLSQMAADPNFSGSRGDTVFRYELGEVTVPILFVAGRADRVVSPERVRAYHDAVGSLDKDFVVISKANGFSGDYGHLDPCCAREASVELFPRIADWLATHPPADRER